MKFDPPIPAIAPAHAGAKARFQFTLEQGAFAGRAFAGTVFACPNPCCPCQTLRFRCHPAVELRGLGPDAPAPFDRPPADLTFGLAVLKRTVDPEAQMSPESLALAHAVVADLQPADWEQWAQWFLAIKRSQMKSLDLDALNAWLPPEVLDGSATMVGFYEVFPWAQEMSFPLAGVAWMVDDQYCVDPDCDCHTTVLSFFRVALDARRPSRAQRSECALRHDYISGKTTVEKRSYRSPEATVLMAALRAAHPGCDDAFRDRHRQLKRLAKRLIPAVVRDSRRASGFRMKEFVSTASSIPPSPPPKPAVNAGRNDPCPCGSGKKYKKCCGL